MRDNFINHNLGEQMTSQEEKARRFLMGKKSKKVSESGAVFQLPPALKMAWYLNNWFEKSIFVLGFFAILYTIGTLLIWGVPWN